MEGGLIFECGNSVHRKRQRWWCSSLRCPGCRARDCDGVGPGRGTRVSAGLATTAAAGWQQKQGTQGQTKEQSAEQLLPARSDEPEAE